MAGTIARPQWLGNNPRLSHFFDLVRNGVKQNVASNGQRQMRNNPGDRGARRTMELPKIATAGAFPSNAHSPITNEQKDRRAYRSRGSRHG